MWADLSGSRAGRAAAALQPQGAGASNDAVLGAAKCERSGVSGGGGPSAAMACLRLAVSRAAARARSPHVGHHHGRVPVYVKSVRGGEVGGE